MRERPKPPTGPGPDADARQAGPPTPIVSLRDVRKGFDGVSVLDGLDLDLPAGQTTVVLGPSGCGKSVTLKLIVGLLRPDHGQIFFDSRRIDTLTERELAPVRLQVGLLFQMGALFDSMSVADNIAFPLREHTPLSREEREHRVERALRTVDMAGFGRKLPSQLSGGQRKRIALARAIVLEPRVVLYDEPTTGLDPVRSDGINELIIRLKEQLHVTSLVVTHDLVSARKVADRVVMLFGGRVIADGTYDQLAASEEPIVRHFLSAKYERDDEVSPSEPTP